MSTSKLPDATAVSADDDSAITAAAETGQFKQLRWILRILPAAFLLLILVLVGREFSSIDIHALRAVLQALTMPQLVAIQLTALAGVLAMGLYDWRASAVFKLGLALPTLTRNAWIANSFNNLLGLSGLAGSGIRMLLLGAEQIDVKKAAAFSTLVMVSMPVGLAAMCWPLLLSGGTGLDNLPVAAWLAWIALGVFAAYLPVYILALHKGWFARLLKDLAPQSLSSIATLIVISIIDWLFAAMVAWLALKFSGAEISWLPFLAAFVLAAALGIVSMIPGGLGVFDGALVLLLTPFASGPEHLVSGVLVYRLCYYLVPWFIAIYLGADRLMLSQYLQQNTLVRHLRSSKLNDLLQLPLDMLATLGVRLLGYLCFGGGVVLLVSAAFPTLRDRLMVLNDYLPLAAIEISHLLSVATGVMLIALSRGIAGQVRSAYYLTQALLVSGAVFSFLKGIDYEEAILLLIVALLLKRQRKSFYREGYPLLGARSLLSIAGLVACIICFALLGDWIHSDTPLGWEVLARFAPALEAPRFWRALLVAATVVTIFIGWSIFKRPAYLPSRPNAQELDEAKAVLDQFGGSEFSHLVFLGDKYLQWSPDRTAFIQYGQIRDTLIALGDPCGNMDEFDSAIISFRDYADRFDLTPCFYEVGEKHLPRYHDAGFSLFKLGESARVKLEDFSLAGKRGESLRGSVNRARREGSEFQLLEQPLSDDTWSQLRAISDAWLLEHSAAEKGFSLGNYNEDYLGRSAMAIIRNKERILAFANLMPDYGSHVELSIDLMRHHPDAPNGTMDFMFVELIQFAKIQGYQYFNLGMAPLGGVGETRYARVGEKVAHLAFKYGNRFYNYQGLMNFKEKYHPEWRSAYLAYPAFTPVPKLMVNCTALIAGGYRRIFFNPG